MTKKAWIMLADGFEETEAVGTWDVLQRGGIEAIFVSINDTLDVEERMDSNFRQIRRWLR